MSLYNTSFMDNATNIFDLFVGLGQQASDGYLIGYLLLGSFFLIFLVLSTKYPFMEVLVVDSFLSMIIGIILLNVGMVAYVGVITPLVIFILSFLFYYFSGRG